MQQHIVHPTDARQGDLMARSTKAAPAAKKSPAKKITKKTTAKKSTVKKSSGRKASPKKVKKPELIDIILKCLDDAKAENTNAIDIRGKSSLSDYMVVTSGRSHRHVSAVADQLSNALSEAGMGKPRIEGMPHCDWVLVDASDVIVHIFRPEVREYYNLEKFWEAATSEETFAD